MAGLLGQTRPSLLSLEKTRRTLEKTQRVDASVQFAGPVAARVPRDCAPTTHLWSDRHFGTLTTLRLDLFMHLRARRAPDVGV